MLSGQIRNVGLMTAMVTSATLDHHGQRVKVDTRSDARWGGGGWADKCTCRLRRFWTYARTLPIWT
jgi:hypothetical protein